MFNWIRTHIRKLTIFLIAAVFGLQFMSKLNDVATGKSTCVCAYDGYGYYMYLTQYFQFRNLIFKQEELQEIQNKYCDSIGVYQIKYFDHGKQLNIYHMGQAFVELPAYTVGHYWAKIGGYPKNGFSKPYHYTFLLNALFFILLGLVMVSKILRLYFSDIITSLLLILVFLGTNYWATAIHSYNLQHIYLFALTAVFFYYLVRYSENLKSKKYLIISALTLGLISAIRPTHVLLGVLPLILLSGKFSKKISYWKVILLFPLAGLLVNIPQLLYWKTMGGSWLIPNLHNEEIILVDPHLFDFLFSYRKGWFLYTPLFLLIIPGFIALYKAQRKLFWAIGMLTVLVIWVFSSWECWWYAASFSSRVMVDIYPILAIPLGYGIVVISKRKIMAIGLMLFLLGTTCLALFQSKQFTFGTLHFERMTKEHYWYIFGKLTIPEYSPDRLSISRDENYWPEKLKEKHYDFYKIDTLSIKHLEKLKLQPRMDKLLIDFELLPRFKTDEVNMQLDLVWNNTNPNYTPVLRLETHSIYNVYNWQSIQLVPGVEQSATDTLHFRFNLPVINHSRDKMQIYVVNNQNDSVLNINYFNLKAIRLNRK